MSFNNLRCNLLLKFWATLLRDRLKETTNNLKKVDFKCLGIAFHLIYLIYFYQFMIFFIRFCSLKALQFRFSKKIGPLVVNNALVAVVFRIAFHGFISISEKNNPFNALIGYVTSLSCLYMLYLICFHNKPSQRYKFRMRFIFVFKCYCCNRRGCH